MRDQNYCDTCYSDAAKAGRPVRDTPHGRVCSLCETRLRNGLAHYCPSNGTEFDIFLGRCCKCRHFDDGGLNDSAVKACAWGVLDRLLNSMAEGYDGKSNWFDPADLDAKTCPATCLRFTHRNDGDGELRDPPRPDVEGQMFLGEVLDVPERLPYVEPARRA